MSNLNHSKVGLQSDRPTFLLSLNDLAVLRSVICGYLAYVRRTVLPSQQSQRQLRLLQGLYQRLSGIPANALEVRIPLMDTEIQALDSALLGFSAFVRQKVQPSQQRDETLQDLEGFRQQLLRMLPTLQV